MLFFALWKVFLDGHTHIHEHSFVKGADKTITPSGQFAMKKCARHFCNFVDTQAGLFGVEWKRQRYITDSLCLGYQFIRHIIWSIYVNARNTNGISSDCENNVNHKVTVPMFAHLSSYPSEIQLLNPLEIVLRFEFERKDTWRKG